MYDSVGLQFEPSSTTYKGKDDFTNGPFAIKECITQYNASTGKQEIVAYEEDNNFAQLSTTGNVMIRFPKFWYKRPSKWEFQVTSNPNSEGEWSPSPMHYRNGKMHDYVYISKYQVNSSFMSQPGYVPYSGGKTAGGTPTINTFRSNLRSKGMYIIDFAAYCSINILMLIKYRTLDMQSVIGYGHNNSTYINFVTSGNTRSVLGRDGYSGSSVSSDASVVTFGIENWWGNTNSWMDGVNHDSTGTTGNVYINTNIQSITSVPTNASNLISAGYKLVTTKLYHNNISSNDFGGYGTITDFSYDSEYPWALFCTGTDNYGTGTTSKHGIISDLYSFAFNRGYITTWCFGGCDFDHQNGPFSVRTDSADSTCRGDLAGVFSMFLSDSYK